jgi:predicted nucleotidyltransferase
MFGTVAIIGSDLQHVLLPRDGWTLAEDASVVVFGSLARGEFSPHSDLDWILLVDGEISGPHLRALQTVRHRLRAAKKLEPSQAGMFGNLVLNKELAPSFGGRDDTIKSLSHRMLLLLESVSIGEDRPRQRIIRAILKAYLARDPRWASTGREICSRSLLNGVVRFGRTMAVDVADTFSDQEG